MKCPKCGYLGFEHVDRCRNCGYDFSLAPSAVTAELPLRAAAQTAGPLDLALAAGSATQARSQAPVAAPELPLFGDSDDRPLITKPSPPRPPLAVRRATPEVPRLRGGQPRAQTLDLEVVAAPPVASEAREQTTSRPAAGDDSGGLESDAGLGARLLAVLIDLAILAGVDATVIYFTMQICGIALWELSILPRAPLFAFLLVQNGGYLVTFTAGGQTLGKMATGIRVVSEESGSPLPFGRAVLRTVIWVVLVVPAGLGFLTALPGRHHRGLHDRLARTRVVRASV